MSLRSLSPAIRRFALAGAVIAGIFAGTQAFAAAPLPTTSNLGSPAGRPHFMLALGQQPETNLGSTNASAGPHNSCCTPPLINSGGPVEKPANVYLDFWGAQWSVGWADVGTSGPTTYPNAAATIQNYLNDFFTAVAGGTTGWNNSQLQYGSSTGPVYHGEWTDTSSVPPLPVVTDNCNELCFSGSAQNFTQLGMEALAAEAHFGYTAGADYMIFLPPGAYPAGFGVYCAYHDEITDSQGRKISYSVMPYLPNVNSLCGENYVNPTDDAYGHGFLDGYSVVGGHEFAEAETDPFPLTAPAWRTSDGGETGDICAWGSPSTYPSGNISTTSNHWAVQSLWSNSANACVMN